MKKHYLLFAFVTCMSSPALAYVGPGLGLNAIGMVLGLLLAIFMLILGAVWYPLKRAWKFFRQQFVNVSENEKTNDNGPRSL